MASRKKKTECVEPGRVQELEIALEEEKSLSRARNVLLESNIRELNDVYQTLNEKLKALRNRDERIKGFEAQLVRANKLSALGELAGSIAHEIKNPLISIQGFAKRITKANDLEKARRYSHFIDQEAGRLTNVLLKLLDFSRMDEPKMEETELGSLVDDTLLFMEHHLTRFKNVSIDIVRSSGPVKVVIDRIHIQQALVNLINNAAQAMPTEAWSGYRPASRTFLASSMSQTKASASMMKLLKRSLSLFLLQNPKAKVPGSACP